jgi:hypothetical protein
VSIGIALAIMLASVWRAAGELHRRVRLVRSQLRITLIACTLGGAWYALVGAAQRNAAQAELPREAIASLGVLLLALAPAALWLRPQWSVRLMSAMAAMVLLIGLIAFPHARWWLALAPLVAVVAAFTWQRIAEFPELPRRLAQGAVLGLSLLALRWPLTVAADCGCVALGLETREAYLLRKNPDYAAVVVANSLVPEDGRLLADDRFGAYLHCPIISAAGCWNLLRSRLAPDELARQLQSQGITHVLVRQPIGAPPLAITECDAAGCVASEPLLPLADFRVTRHDASVWRYCLLRVR